ncbi:viral protein TPX [Actinomyces viscosus]|nr:viral protein TPX [Actinomyces viscosus]
MPELTIRRFSAPRSALAVLSVLTVSSALALSGAPGHALPAAEDDVSMTLSTDIVIREDETFTMKFTASESGSTQTLSKSVCNEETFDTDNSNDKDVKVEFKEEGDTRTCTLQGSNSISESTDNVTHSGDEFIVTTPEFNDQPSSTTLNITQSVTFPGEVTEADGGETDGTKVSFNDGDSHRVKGKDKAASGATSGAQDSAGESGSTSTWVWALVGLLAVAVAGGIVAVVIMNQRKKNQPQFFPYATPAQGYDPNQALVSPPGQPVQPYQPGQPVQPYPPGQPVQPYQPGYTEPQAQPYQQPYNGQPEQPYNGYPGQGY